jgi:hypothetical protein
MMPSMMLGDTSAVLGAVGIVDPVIEVVICIHEADVPRDAARPDQDFGLDICRYRYILCVWPEQQRQQMLSTPWPSLGGERSSTSLSEASDL